MGILIVPGHGGKDPGAVFNSLKEKDITLNVSKDIFRVIGNKNVYISRVTDIYMSVNQVVNWIEPFKALGDVDLWWIHVNAASSSNANGVEIFRSISNTQEDGRLKFILDQYCKTFGLTNRGIKNRRLDKDKNADYYWIHRLTPSWCKSKLIELFFLSNPQDRKIYEANKALFGPVLARLIQGQKLEDEIPKKQTKIITLSDVYDKLLDIEKKLK
jgi:N-acetylmuramoyl-L-alanine amidase